jgi:transcriptional regulator with XRE-family HTH domain
MGQFIAAERAHVAIGQDEREFFVQLGARMAETRKRLGITQVQMGETLGVSQQTVNAYEAGQRRVPVSMLPLLARTLGVSVEELIGEPPSPAARKRGPAPALQRHMERISALPKAQQKFVLQVLESVLQQAR